MKNLSVKKLFLVDSIGAFVTMIMLGIVLPQFENIFGVPSWASYYLALIAGIFSIYSLLCFLLIVKNQSRFLRIIAVANLAYICLSIFLVVYLYKSVTVFGMMYFALEIAVILVLVVIELKKASAFASVRSR